MRRLNRLKCALLVLSFAYLTEACAPKPPNVFVFEDMDQHLSTDPATGHLILVPSPTCMKQISEPECGHGIAIVSGDQIFVGEGLNHLYKGKPWSQLKRESVYMPAVESYAPLADYVIDSCKKMNCSDQITRFKVKLDSLNGITALIPKPNE